MLFRKNKAVRFEKRYRFLINNVLDILGELNLEGIFSYVNPYIYNVLGYKPKEIIGKCLFDLIHINDLQKVTLIFKNALKNEKNLFCEFKILHKNGTFIDVSLNGKIQNVSENSQITAVIKDITDIKRSEQKLIESEEKYRNLVETSSMCLLEIDVKNGGIVYINPRLLEIIGYTQEEIINRGLFYKAIFSEDYNKLIRSNDEKKLQFRIRNKDGQIKWLSGRILHHTNEKGELLFLRVWLQDITELKELQEIKTNLLTRISHEIKTPLISIKGFTDLLLNCYKSNLNRKIISYLERIKDGGERLKLLINRFLETKQLEKNLVELNFSYENLSMLIKKEVKDMEGLIKLRNQMVNVDIDDELNNYFDKEKIQSVISNLLINAIKYTPTNGKILIKSHIRKKFIITSIGDNGIGLQEDEIKKLFKPFGKIEKYGKGWDIISDGAGLGLYLSKEIVNLHNGEIWAKSPGLYKGSTFYFSLPLIESI